MEPVIKVIIPAYNEERTIRETIQDVQKHLPQAEIVIIDNNSSDKTTQLSANTLLRGPNPWRILNEPNQGKGNAVRKAFSLIDADVFLMMDADTTYSAADAQKLIEPILRQEAHMVVGDRLSAGQYKNENKRPFHNFGNKLVRRLINWSFGSNLRDVMSGYRAFSRAFVQNYPVMAGGFELETELSLHALDKRLQIVEVDISYRDRPSGSHSKLNTLRDGTRVIGTIFNIFRMYKPLAFFGTVATSLVIMSFLSAIPSVADYIETGNVYHLPTAVLSVGLALSGLLAFAVGLILDAISKANQRIFEVNIAQSIRS